MKQLFRRNTCFLNSAIQILSNIRIFTIYFLSEQYKEDINHDKKEVAFLKEWVKLMVAMWEDNCIVKPISFKKVLGRFYESYNSYRQNDSQEALHKIIDLLHESVSYEVDIKHKDNWLEILGCGITHKKILHNFKLDKITEKVFAFGVGVERLVMIKNNIDNIHQLRTN